MRAAERLLAALLALAPCAIAAAPEELGTLFHTPEERARLDRLRRGETPENVSTGASGAAELTGFVKRSDGRNTVWIDGVAVPVAGTKNAPLFDPKAVRGYSEGGDPVKIERRPDK